MPSPATPQATPPLAPGGSSTNEPATSPAANAKAAVSGTGAEYERQFHAYTTNHIPWWIRAMWICYWIGAIYYATQYVIPMVREYY